MAGRHRQPGAVTRTRSECALGAERRAEVVAATGSWLHRARSLYGHPLPEIPVHFDLFGRSAGMYRVRGKQREIRYNPVIFAGWYAENMADTVPHEVAHYVVDVLHGRRARPHGAEWRGVMTSFGLVAKRTGDFDLSGLSLRTERRFTYACPCTRHELSATRHNRVSRGQRRYRCLACGGELVPAG